MRYEFNINGVYIGKTEECNMSTETPIPDDVLEIGESWCWSGIQWEKINQQEQPVNFEINIKNTYFYKSKISDRDQLLAASDWTQLPDSPFDAATKLAWATYRQALRDLPEKPKFPNIQFPQEPK